MRLVYFDIDCLRPDHLGCYGYHRATSPNIDSLAGRGLRFDRVYASDVPCLPSRTALFSGRFGVHTGVVGHGGSAAEPTPEGPSRGFNSMFGRTGWMRAMRDAGLYTASVSPFSERHGAHHVTAGFNEIINTGRRGLENADEIGEAALAWIERNRDRDDWLLHVNFWDPHTPYRAPESLGEPFACDPLPDWYTETVRRSHWDGVGPHSAREVNGFSDDPGDYPTRWPRQPIAIDSVDAARKLFDGYDTGVAYADEWVGRVCDALAADCAVMVSADHGDNLGELNVYGDHQTADEFTARVPMILCWPDRWTGGAVEPGLLYQVDVAASIVELAGGTVPDNWDGESFAKSLGTGSGRDALFLSQGAWTAQRAVRFRDGGRELIAIRTYHDGYHAFPEHMLFDLSTDPHEQADIAASEPELVQRAMKLLDDWEAETTGGRADPLQDVVREQPKHVRGELDRYLERLRATGRGDWADRIEQRHKTNG